jgi:hypothetical protein
VFRPLRPAICLFGVLIAVPAAAQQRAGPPAAPAPAPSAPHRLVPPTAADVAREQAPSGRVAIAEQDNMRLGLGLLSVSGHFVRDRSTGGREPLIGTTGRQNRVAAIGFSLRF